MTQELVSIDLYAQFGFLKKPDINDGIYLSYNMLHKPALLGILGAIAGLKGYSIEGEMEPSDVPEYRKELEELKVAIQPLHSQNGNFSKEVIKYTNTVGYASEETGGVLIIDEQTLIRPSYRVYLLLDIDNELQLTLYDRLKNQEAEFIPYLGKNDHQLWWKNFWVWKILENEYKPNQNFRVDSIFIKPSGEKLQREARLVSYGEDSVRFMYFERLPEGWHLELPHYQLVEFLLTNYPLSPEVEISNLLKIQNDQNEQAIIQVF